MLRNKRHADWLPKGMYSAKVKIHAAGDSGHEPATKIVTAKVKVK